MDRAGAVHVARDEEIAGRFALEGIVRVRVEGRGGVERLLSVADRTGVALPVFEAVRTAGVADEHLAVGIGRGGVAVGLDAIHGEAGEFVSADDGGGRAGCGVAELGGAATGVGAGIQAGLGDGGGTDDIYAGALVVGRDQDERVGVGRGEGLGAGDGAVKLDGFENPTVGIHTVGLLVDGGSFDHEHKAGGVFRQNRECGVDHLVEHGLIREAEFIHDGRATAAAVDLVGGHIHI